MPKSYKLLITLISIALGSCRVSTSLYSSDDPINVKITSSCRNPVVTSTLKESELKAITKASGSESTKKLKFRQKSSVVKADYRIISTDLTINEHCSAGSTSPIIKVSQVLKLENVKTREHLEFTSDTTLIDQQSLTQPVKKTSNPAAVIPVLTNENYKKLKRHGKG